MKKRLLNVSLIFAAALIFPAAALGSPINTGLESSQSIEHSIYFETILNDGSIGAYLQKPIKVLRMCL